MISIIIPVYNMEKYIDRCIQSCISQTYQNFQLILVDDGSTDSSGAICDRYAESDRRIICIHKANGGVASAKNTGISVAKGEYITFVDSDDYIDADYLSCLMENAETSDMVIAGLRFLEDNGIRVYAEMNLQENVVFSREQFREKLWGLLDLDGLNFHVAKLYKRSIVSEHGLRFTDFKKTGGDDTVFNFDFLEKANTVTVVNRNIYNYISYTNSTSNRYDPNKWGRGKVLDSIITQKCLDMRILSDEMVFALDKRICKLAYWVSTEIAALNIPLGDKKKAIQVISNDERFIQAYRETFEKTQYDSIVKLLFDKKVDWYIVCVLWRRLNIKKCIYQYVPNGIKLIYRKCKHKSD